MAKKVVVIGGGVIGLSCAYHLLQDGHEVIVLDRGQQDSERCSTGNSGLVVPSHFVPLAAPGMVAYGLRQMFNAKSPFRLKPEFNLDLAKWLFRFWQSARESKVEQSSPILRDLNLLSRKRFLELSRELEFGIEQRGLLMVCRTEKGLRHELDVVTKAHSLGLEAEHVTSSDLASLEPNANYDAEGGVLFPQDCSLDPLEFVRALQSVVPDVRYGTDVLTFSTSDGMVQSVRTDSGTIEGDAFVLAGGVWSSKLVEPLGLHMPLQAGKGYSMTLDSPAAQLKIPSILVEGRVALTPLGTNLRVGGTMELAGIDESIDPKRVEGIVDTLCTYLPQFERQDFSGQPIWKGLRPCSPDGLPYLGPFKRFSNLFAATGHAMMGLSLAPVTGMLIAQYVGGCKPEIDSPLLAPDRF